MPAWATLLKGKGIIFNFKTKLYKLNRHFDMRVKPFNRAALSSICVLSSVKLQYQRKPVVVKHVLLLVFICFVSFELEEEVKQHLLNAFFALVTLLTSDVILNYGVIQNVATETSENTFCHLSK